MLLNNKKKKYRLIILEHDFNQAEVARGNVLGAARSPNSNCFPTYLIDGGERFLGVTKVIGRFRNGGFGSCANLVRG